jgi:hypothetical protein
MTANRQPNLFLAEYLGLSRIVHQSKLVPLLQFCNSNLDITRKPDPVPRARGRTVLFLGEAREGWINQ